MADERLTQEDLARDPAIRPVGFFVAEADGRLRCTLCPRHCRLLDGQRGLCWVRGRVGEQMVLTSWGRSSGFCIDPIEKKPLNHFLPGTPILSFGTAGCNLSCSFCQNWSISKARHDDTLASAADPAAIAGLAVAHGCPAVAMTYNDPVIYLEYAAEIAAACRAQGIKTVAVTAGYVAEPARDTFCRLYDAANVDLKAFTEAFYVRHCGGHLQPVLDTLRWMVREARVWTELTTLVIPGENDSDREMASLAAWVAAELGPDVPLHLSAFHPDYKLQDRPATPPATLTRLRAVAKREGLRHVYTGNVHDSAGGSTWCHGCGALLIARDWYELGAFRLRDGCCPDCGVPCAGVWAPAPGTWGRRRRVVG